MTIEEYRTSLKEDIKELEQELNSLDPSESIVKQGVLLGKINGIYQAIRKSYEVE